MTELTVASFAKPFYGLERQGTPRQPKTVPLVVIAFQPRDQELPVAQGGFGVPAFDAITAAGLENLFFGSTNSIAQYLREVSQGRFKLVPFLPSRPIVGRYVSGYDCHFYTRDGAYAPPTNPSDRHYYISGGVTYYKDDEGFIDPNMHAWAEAIQLAAADGVDFAKLKQQGGGVVVVRPWNRVEGYCRDVYGSQVPSKSLEVCGVIVSHVADVILIPSIAHDADSIGVALEEVLHLLVNLGDQYPDNDHRRADDPRQPGQLSIGARLPVHVDPYHKLKWGWLNPTLVTESGVYELRQAATTGDALILASHRGTAEFFILENRERGSSFDKFRAPGWGDGLALWNCLQKEDLSPDWARRALHLRRADPRPNAAGQVQDDRALFDGANAQQSYYLNDDSYPQSLRFDDGTESGLRIVWMSRAGETMHVCVMVDRPDATPAVLSALWGPRDSLSASLAELLL